MPPSIHPTAFVSPDCRLGEGVEIGPFCVVNGAVTLGDGVRLVSQVHVQGPVAIGAGTVVYPGACIGFPAQDVKFKLGDPTGGVRIGANCIIREHVTIHAATKTDVPTTIGDRVFMMVGSHAGHDARVDNEAVLVNGAMLAGHSWVGEKAIMSGNAALHQFNRVGRLAMVSGVVGISMDVPPFCLVGERNKLRGINRVGLRRAGVTRQEIDAVVEAFREAFRTPRPRAEMLAVLDERARESPMVAELAQFVRTAKRAICVANTMADEEELAM